MENIAPVASFESYHALPMSSLGHQRLFLVTSFEFLYLRAHALKKMLDIVFSKKCWIFSEGLTMPPLDKRHIILGACWATNINLIYSRFQPTVFVIATQLRSAPSRKVETHVNKTLGINRSTNHQLNNVRKLLML